MVDAIDIIEAKTSEQIAQAREMFHEYAKWLEADHGISLEFQGIEAELAGLPGKYAPPRGALILAMRSGEGLGCAAIRPFDETTGEVKRLYVRPAGRGLRIGTRLAEEIVLHGRRLGYARLVLDTAAFMTEAQRIYAAAGFETIEPYYRNPYQDIRYMGLDLIGDRGA